MNNSSIIGISLEELELRITEAYKRGWEECSREMNEADWLNGREAIIAFLSPVKPITVRTFNLKRERGEFGSAVIGCGENCKARKSELLTAIQQYQLSKL